MDLSLKETGFLHVITGPMFSGKTSSLIKMIRSFKNQNIPTLVLKHSLDNRYDGCDYICSHNSIKEPCQSTDNLLKYLDHEDYKLAKVIVIEESQFFGPDIVEFCEKAIDQDNKYVIASGLSGDFRRKPFGYMPQLESLAHVKEHLNAECHFCRNNIYAPYTAKISGSDQTVEVGEADKYQPVCLTHWLENNKNKST